MTTPTSTLGKFFSGLARLYRGLRSVILNLIFISLLLIIVGSLFGEPPIMVQRGSALLINPEGAIVDQLTFVDPLNVLMADSLGNNVNAEVLLQDLLDAIDFASTDDDISSIVLSLNNLQPSGFSKLQEIGKALQQFTESGKKVYAVADNYTQGQYYLAAHANEIILNPMGSIGLEGFSTYQYYYRDALDKLGVNVHIFRVGEYKSAVEPYERNNMSEEAREAANDWIGDLWRQYIDNINQSRDFEANFLGELISNLDTHLAEFNGDFAQLAVDRNLVDSVMNRGELNEYLKESIGPTSGNDDFLHINVENYLSARNNQLNTLQQSNDKIGIIVASGTIYDGRRTAGEIGGDTLQGLIRQARENDSIKAVVLRVDSPGGSAFASEVIRNELEALVNAGKPLVVSMGSVAASGGYWIATAADEIWASNSTITGSIGIFGLYPTFEESFGKLGINTDGVGTTELAGALAVGRELPDLAGNILQLTLEDGYRRFISLVATARNMSVEEADALARGRVWSGEDALTLGLVDKIGNLEQAVASAATLAQLESYAIQIIKQELTPGQQLIQDLANSVTFTSAINFVFNPAIKRHFMSQEAIATNSVIADFYTVVNENLQAIFQFNDPNGLYLQCQECQTALSP